jgi:hypothetical protein
MNTEIIKEYVFLMKANHHYTHQKVNPVFLKITTVISRLVARIHKIKIMNQIWANKFKNKMK